MNENIPIVPGAARPALEFEGPLDARESFRQDLRRAMELAARDGARAAVIVVEVDPNYGERAPERVASVAARWPRQRFQALHLCRLARNRFALIAAPIALPGHARALAERFTRALDPRLCPLLRRALPYAWYGVGVYPDDGTDVESLMARAEQAAERMRGAAPRRRRIAPARRRNTGGGLLGAIPAR